MQGLRAGLVFAFAFVSVIVVVVIVFLYIYTYLSTYHWGGYWIRAKVKAGGRF